MAAQAAQFAPNAQGWKANDVPDAALHGNGFTCPGCGLRYAAIGIFNPCPAKLACNNCDGTGRIARAVADIIADHVAEAKKLHWTKDSIK